METEEKINIICDKLGYERNIVGVGWYVRNGAVVASR
jgi:hypothetical protein